jgi:hypothetical protein
MGLHLGLSGWRPLGVEILVNLACTLPSSKGSRMQVTAFSTPAQPFWRWRISKYSGEVVEESRDVFRTIAVALDAGRTRLGEMEVTPEPESHAWGRLPSWGRRAAR